MPPECDTTGGSGRDEVIVGLSGGVDSAVSALLLLEAGHRVRGLFMKNWEEDDTDAYCAAAADREDAQAVCDRLGIDLLTVNFATEYWDRVFEEMVAGYAAGITPNPDVLCNREIKFREFLDHALDLGAGRIATGHYAGVDHGEGGYRLLRAADENKDQTYFLHLLDQRALSRTLFPLAGLDKSEVRAIARRAGLPVSGKKDSTGICFVGKRRFRDFLDRFLPAQRGEIRTLDGRAVGEHDGAFAYTVGQRHGLGLGGAGAAWYVAARDVTANIVYVVQGHDHPALYARAVTVSGLHWIGGDEAAPDLRCRVRTRHRQPLQEADVELLGGGRARIAFAQAQRAPAPGQSAVLYQGRECLGGGFIAQVESIDGRTGQARNAA